MSILGPIIAMFYSLQTFQVNLFSPKSYLFIECGFFPGLYLENYISPDLSNVSLTVLEGEVIYEDELKLGSVHLKKNERTFIPTSIFHKVHTISQTPSCYMYTYLNKTREILKEEERPPDFDKTMRSPFPLLEDRTQLAEGTGRMLGFIANAFLNVLYDVPMVRRTRMA